MRKIFLLFSFIILFVGCEKHQEPTLPTKYEYSVIFSGDWAEVCQATAYVINPKGEKETVQVDLSKKSEWSFDGGAPDSCGVFIEFTPINVEKWDKEFYELTIECKSVINDKIASCSETYNVLKEYVVDQLSSAPVLLSGKVDAIGTSYSFANLDFGLNSDPSYPIQPQDDDQKGNSIEINNAGLSLLSPWFPRLFALLGYLNEEKNDFKNEASRIRAIFVLQYLTCQEEKEYSETELFYNRLLVGLPSDVVLPKQLALTEEEKEYADSMLSGIKSNWPQMSGTSVRGFVMSFVARKGKIVKGEDKWVLTVENKVYDVLLDYVLWAFRQIRFPWVKPYIQVNWHEHEAY